MQSESRLLVLLSASCERDCSMCHAPSKLRPKSEMVPQSMNISACMLMYIYILILKPGQRVYDQTYKLPNFASYCILRTPGKADSGYDIYRSGGSNGRKSDRNSASKHKANEYETRIQLFLYSDMPFLKPFLRDCSRGKRRISTWSVLL